jgi:hypothetical protein
MREMRKFLPERLPAKHALVSPKKSLSCALEIAAHPSSGRCNFGNRNHCSSA